MTSLYYRVYYTIYRGLIWLGQEANTDSTWFNAFFIHSIFVMLIVLALLAFFIAFVGRSMIVHSQVQSILLLLLLFGGNAYAIFYKQKYKKVEGELSATWVRMKSSNILLTVVFIFLSITLVVLSLNYLKAHPFHS